MTERQDIPSARDPATSARPPADETGWPPILRALRREFRDNFARVIAGKDPVARLLGYRNLMKTKYGVDLPAAKRKAKKTVGRRDGEGQGDAS